jgi:hypothetical protein
MIQQFVGAGAVAACAYVCAAYACVGVAAATYIHRCSCLCGCCSCLFGGRARIRLTQLSMLELGQSMAKTKNWPREGSSMFFLVQMPLFL